MSHEGTRTDRKTDGPPSSTSSAKRLLHFSALGVAASSDDSLLGARASRPHQAGRSLGPLPHLLPPGTAPWLSFRLANAVPTGRVAGGSIARKLCGGQRHSMRAGRPRSQGLPSRRRGGDVWQATSQKADLRPLGNSRLPASHAPTLPRGSFEEKRLIVDEDEPRRDPNRPEDGWTSFIDKQRQKASAL